ncbi:hypothetical protein [Nannocystis pusilla]|uniref:hypothetical protein n=1 Tax=Nannocystis pusilla TaxID=889268 RepID=UPI003B7FFC1A
MTSPVGPVIRTRSLSAVFAVSTLFLSACGDRPLEDQPEDGCALDQPSLLVPLPAGWDPDEPSSSLSMWVTDNHLLYHFDEFRQHGRFDLVPSAAAPALVAEKAPLYLAYSVMNSEQGPVFYQSGITRWT